MAEENGRNGRAVLPWVQFAWTVSIAVVGGVITGVGGFYASREQLRAEIAAQIVRVRVEIAQERKADLDRYLPLTTYWQWREEMKGSLNEISRKLDRIEFRLK